MPAATFPGSHEIQQDDKGGGVQMPTYDYECTQCNIRFEVGDLAHP